jgi:3-mercaptopyruvate sulfurtransferase SseA
LAYEFLYRRGYRNLKILEGGIPDWYRKGYPVAGRRVGAIEHAPYAPEVVEFERRLRAEAPPR